MKTRPRYLWIVGWGVHCVCGYRAGRAVLHRSTVNALLFRSSAEAARFRRRKLNRDPCKFKILRLSDIITRLETK